MIVLDISGMTSEACCEAIQQAISARDPGATVVIMRIAGRAAIDTTLTVEEAVEAVRGAGYRAALALSA